MEEFQPKPKEDVMIFSSIFLALLAVSLSVFIMPWEKVSFQSNKPITLLPIAPPISTNCKKGVSTFSVGENCENGMYKYADFTCYDNTKGKFSETKCKSSAQFYQASEYACKILSEPACFEPVISPVPEIPDLTLTPTIINQCQTEGNDCPVPFDCCQGLTCQTADNQTGRCTSLPTPAVPNCNTGLFKSICGFKGYTWCKLGSKECDTGWIDQPTVLVSCPKNSLFTTDGEFCQKPDGLVKFTGAIGKCQVNKSCQTNR